MKYRHFIAIALVTLLAACTNGGTVYQVPISEARRILLATAFPPYLFGNMTPDWHVNAMGNSEVVWIVRKDGKEVVRYVASLKEEGQGSTRVKGEVKETSAPAGKTEKKPTDNPALKDLYLVAINERIASALERRAFDTSKTRPALAAAAIGNMGAIRASADEAAAAADRLERGRR
jgi:hypothetical protein